VAEAGKRMVHGRPFGSWAAGSVQEPIQTLQGTPYNNPGPDDGDRRTASSDSRQNPAAGCAIMAE
jgi:hypothetical protein